MPTEAPATELKITDEQEAAQLVLNTLSTTPKAIKTKEEYELFMGELATAKVRISKVKDFFLDLRRPLNQAAKKLSEKENAMLEPLEDRYKAIKKMCESWYMADLAETRRRQEAENKKHEAKVETAIAKGKDPASIAPPKQVVSKAPAAVAVAGVGTVSMKLDKHFRLKDMDLTSRQLIDTTSLKVYRNDKGVQAIPDNCWRLDHSRLLELVKAGMLIEGVEQIELPGNRLT